MAIAIPFVEVVLALVAIYLVIHLFRKKHDPRYPPGPSFAIPVLGNILQLGREPNKVFQKWGEQYGDVYSFKMGSDNVIMLNEPKIIKDVFAETSSAGRTPNPIIVAIANGNYGIIVGEGAHWEQQRRFTLRTLRDLGFAKTSMEGIILDEVNSMLKFFEKGLDVAISGNRIFNGPVVNALWTIISGEREEWDRADKPDIMKHAFELVMALDRMTSSGLMFAPALRHIAPDFFGWTKWITNIANLMGVCNKSIERHASSLDDSSPQDLIDHYLIEKKKTTEPSSSFYKETGDKNMVAVIADLFLAGSETTSHTLSWLMIHLAHYPKVLKKLQNELDNVIGSSRQPSLTDKLNLPYTEATIMEILRRTSVINTGVPHRMLEDAVIHGYFFPKNTTIISNLFFVHNDPRIWGDPKNFRPERFLSADGSKIVKHDAFLPFSSGKRVCLGESLARDTLFMFLACIVQKFDIKPVPGSNLEDLKEDVVPKNSLLNEPGPFQIIVSLRKQ